MISNATSLKAKIKNYAKKNHITAQVVLQNYMFERFLDRLSESNYCDKFIIKGGMLISSLVGLDTRTTMDLDATLRKMSLNKEKITKAIHDICEMNLNDEIIFEVVSILPIRKDDIYGGYRVRLDVRFDTIITPLSIDISAGDIITPLAVQYNFRKIFSEKENITLWVYNVETIMAEKVETILSRGVYNTRPRDFYDIYILSSTQTFDKHIFHDALIATMKHRGSIEKLRDMNSIVSNISESHDLKERWYKYQKKFTYALNIDYELIMETLNHLLDDLEFGSERCY